MSNDNREDETEVDVDRFVRQFRNVYELRLMAAVGRSKLFEKLGKPTLAAIETGKAAAYKQVLESEILDKLSQSNDKAVAADREKGL